MKSDIKGLWVFFFYQVDDGIGDIGGFGRLGDVCERQIVGVAGVGVVGGVVVVGVAGVVVVVVVVAVVVFCLFFTPVEDYEYRGLCRCVL